jgi:hypothetical protein
VGPGELGGDAARPYQALSFLARVAVQVAEVPRPVDVALEVAFLRSCGPTLRMAESAGRDPVAALHKGDIDSPP